MTDGESLPVPMAQLCDPANWSYVAAALEPVPAPHINDRDVGWPSGLQIAAAHFRYRHYRSLQAPLAALASPSRCAAMEPWRPMLDRDGIALHSFGVERPQVALIDAERFRYFDRGDGWGAKFTLPAAGILLHTPEEAP